MSQPCSCREACPALQTGLPGHQARRSDQQAVWWAAAALLRSKAAHRAQPDSAVLAGGGRDPASAQDHPHSPLGGVQRPAEHAHAGGHRGRGQAAGHQGPRVPGPAALRVHRLPASCEPRSGAVRAALGRAGPGLLWPQGSGLPPPAQLWPARQLLEPNVPASLLCTRCTHLSCWPCRWLHHVPPPCRLLLRLALPRCVLPSVPSHCCLPADDRASRRARPKILVRVQDQDSRHSLGLQELEGANLDVAMSQHLLVAADRFALSRLRRICEGRLCETVEVSSRDQGAGCRGRLNPKPKP